MAREWALRFGLEMTSNSHHQLSLPVFNDIPPPAQRPGLHPSLWMKEIRQMSHQMSQQLEVLTQGWTSLVLLFQGSRGPVLASIDHLCQTVCILTKGIPLVRGSEG